MPVVRQADRDATDSASLPNAAGKAVSTLRASIVIPTYNRSASLERVLLALDHQTVPSDCYEVVLVVDGCTDDTTSRCQELALRVSYRLRIIEQANAGPAVARNRGVHEAVTDLILFIDDDVVPEPDWVATHLAAHRSAARDYIVAFGPLLPPPDFRLNAWGDWEEHVLCEQYYQMEAGDWQPTYRQFYTGNASIAKRHILAAGGFDTTFMRAEDIELGLRLHRNGCVFTFLPSARGWHYVQRSFGSWSRMPIAYGRATVAMSTTSAPIALENAASEYLTRNLAIRLCARLCLNSPARARTQTEALHIVAVISWWLRLSIVSRAACSIIYNVCYYCGLASELPNAAAFWRLVRAAQRQQRCPDLGRPLSALAVEILAQCGCQGPRHATS